MHISYSVPWIFSKASSKVFNRLRLYRLLCIVGGSIWLWEDHSSSNISNDQRPRVDSYSHWGADWFQGGPPLYDFVRMWMCK